MRGDARLQWYLVKSCHLVDQCRFPNLRRHRLHVAVAHAGTVSNCAEKAAEEKKARRTSRVRPLQRSRACTHAWSGRRASIALLTGRKRVQSKSKTKRRRRFEGGGSALGGRARKRLCDHYLFTWSSRCADAADSLAFTCSCNTRSFSGNSRCSCCIWRNSAMYARSRVKNMAAREIRRDTRRRKGGRPPRTRPSCRQLSARTDCSMFLLQRGCLTNAVA